MADTSYHQPSTWKPIDLDLEKAVGQPIEDLDNQKQDNSARRLPGHLLGYPLGPAYSNDRPLFQKSPGFKSINMPPASRGSSRARSATRRDGNGMNGRPEAEDSGTSISRSSPSRGGIKKSRVTKPRASRATRQASITPKQPTTMQKEAARILESEPAKVAAGPSKTASGRTPLTSKALSSAKRKRPTQIDDNYDDYSSDNQRPVKKRASLIAFGKRPDVKSRGHGLACPFYRFDPIGSRECRDFLLTKISYVKQHITRHHRRPAFCPLCMEEFDDEDYLQEHLRDQSCSKKEEYTKPRGVTEDQLKRLRGRVDQKKTVEDQWYDIFFILFPGAERPKSVYVDHDISPDVGDYVGYLLYQFEEMIPMLLGLEQQRINFPPPSFSESAGATNTISSRSGNSATGGMPGMPGGAGVGSSTAPLSTSGGPGGVQLMSTYLKTGTVKIDIDNFKKALQKETRKMYKDWCIKKKGEAEAARKVKKAKKKAKQKMAKRRAGQAVDDEDSSSDESELGAYEYDSENQWPIVEYDDDALSPSELQDKYEGLQRDFQARQHTMYNPPVEPAPSETITNPSLSTIYASSSTQPIPQPPPHFQSNPLKSMHHGSLAPLQPISEHRQQHQQQQQLYLPQNSYMQLSPTAGPPQSSPVYPSAPPPFSRPSTSQPSIAAAASRHTSPKNEEGVNGRKGMAIETLLGPTHPHDQ